jgi:hypothetical protein
LDGAYQVEPKPNQVDKVIARQRLAAHMGVDEPKASEPPFRRAQTSDVRQHESPSVTDDDVVDLTGPMNENPYLPPGFDTRVDERTREFRRYNVAGRYPPTIQALQRLGCGGRET